MNRPRPKIQGGAGLVATATLAKTMIETPEKKAKTMGQSAANLPV